MSTAPLLHLVARHDGDYYNDDKLADLAARIRTEHAAVCSSARKTLEHALRVGALLIEAKDLMSHGSWRLWVHQHCDVSERSAQNYMRLARNWAVRTANPQLTADMTIDAALRGRAQLRGVGEALFSALERKLPMAAYRPFKLAPDGTVIHSGIIEIARIALWRAVEMTGAEAHLELFSAFRQILDQLEQGDYKILDA